MINPELRENRPAQPNQNSSEPGASSERSAREPILNDFGGIEIGDPDQREQRAAAIAIRPPERLLAEEEKVDPQIDQNPVCGEDTDNTIESDIPDEEDFVFGNEVGFKNEHYNQFVDQSLIMKSIQWQKDSHGLFDYEMRQIIKSNFKVNSSKMCVRNDQVIRFEDIDLDVKDRFGNQFQELFKVHKIRNKYFIEGVVPSD